MMLLIAFFIPPLYFLIRGRIGAFIVNCFFYGLAWIFLITVIGAFIAPFFWIIAFSHAGWNLYQEMARKAMTEHATLIAEKMAERMQETARHEGT